MRKVWASEHLLRSDEFKRGYIYGRRYLKRWPQKPTMAPNIPVDDFDCGWNAGMRAELHARGYPAAV